MRRLAAGRGALAFALTALLAAAESAAQTSLGACTDRSMSPSFPPTDANRLTAAEVKARIMGRPWHYSRRDAKNNVNLRFESIMRHDGSFATKCEWYRETNRYSIAGWIPCTGVTDTGGSRDVGTWRQADPKGVFCTTGRTGTAMSEDYCYSFHHSDGRFVLKPISGRYYCSPGDFEVR